MTATAPQTNILLIEDNPADVELASLLLAEKGNGATLNDKKIRVSNQHEVVHACLVTGFPYTYINMPNGPLEIFERFIRKGVPVRRLGCAAERHTPVGFDELFG